MSPRPSKPRSARVAREKSECFRGAHLVIAPLLEILEGVAELRGELRGCALVLLEERRHRRGPTSCRPSLAAPLDLPQRRRLKRRGGTKVAPPPPRVRGPATQMEAGIGRLPPDRPGACSFSCACHRASRRSLARASTILRAHLRILFGDHGAHHARHAPPPRGAQRGVGEHP